MPKKDISKSPKTSRRPATTIEARENQLINLAIRQAEEQLATGTAPAQIVVHYLKLATTREKLEKERLISENELLRAKTESIKAQKQADEMYGRAVAAMKEYGGGIREDEDLF